jgi:hypothetical protein
VGSGGAQAAVWLAAVACCSAAYVPALRRHSRSSVRRTRPAAAAAASGTVPGELVSLARLQWLVLNGNALAGAPPALLGQLPALRGARLEDNRLSGPLPDEWCANNASYTFKGNARLCGGCCASCAGASLLALQATVLRA